MFPMPQEYAPPMHLFKQNSHSGVHHTGRLDQLGARIISPSRTHQVADLLLRKRDSAVPKLTKQMPATWPEWKRAALRQGALASVPQEELAREFFP